MMNIILRTALPARFYESPADSLGELTFDIQFCKFQCKLVSFVLYVIVDLAESLCLEMFLFFLGFYHGLEM